MLTKVLNGKRVQMSAAEEAEFRAHRTLIRAEALKENADEAAEKTRKEAARASAVTKLEGMGLTSEEIDALIRR